MDDAQLYDEFGNYIGPDIDSDSSSGDGGAQQVAAAGAGGGDGAVEDGSGSGSDDGGVMGMDAVPTTGGAGMATSTAVVLHEDKKYYRTASETYGEGVETLVQEEDTQDLETPIIAPAVKKKYDLATDEGATLPASNVEPEYLLGLAAGLPERIRNVAVVGSLHHGKTLLMDMLVQETHAGNPGIDNIPQTFKDMVDLRYTDIRTDERARLISVKAQPMSLLLEDSRHKSRILNLMDTPGHPNFTDEVTASLRLADGAVVVIDAVEGVVMQTERLLRHVVEAGLAVVVVINKVDRLILELKLPPNDAYHKLRHTIEEVNDILEVLSHGTAVQRVDPALGNVLFASFLHSWIFSLDSFANKYAIDQGLDDDFDTAAFARRLWGDYYMHPSLRVLQRKPPSSESSRTFVEFVMEPLYKLYAQVIGEAPGGSLADTLGTLGVELNGSERVLDSKPLLKVVCRKFFGESTPLVDAVVNHIPSPVEAAPSKVQLSYTGPLNEPAAAAMMDADASGPLMVNVCKLYPRSDGEKFDALGRVLSGTLVPGQEVVVLGEGYTALFDEERAGATVDALWIYQTRYRIPVDKATPGMWVLIAGVDASITKTATLTVPDNEDPFVFSPLAFNTEATVKVAIEPLKPAELPKMMDGLTKINKSYPLLTTRVEESGERILLGTGELYMDSALNDLRNMYAHIEVKVADPVVTFRETVSQDSECIVYAESPNKRNKLTMMAQRLDDGLADDIQAGNISAAWSKRERAEFLQANYDWDLLAARSVWAFGPDANTGPNILIDDTLPSEVNKTLLASVRDYVVQGFQWATREGPLCDEPMRGVKFRIVNATVAEEALGRAGGQIIPTARRVAYASFLVAHPRLMEPVYMTEIHAPPDSITAIYDVVARRRGHVESDYPQAGSPLYCVKAYVPVIDSFGFETDLRSHTQGLAMCLSVFDHWEVLRSNPLDRSIQLFPLEPAEPLALARDFMVKTRRRKGLAEDVSIAKYIDDEALLKLAELSM